MPEKRAHTRRLMREGAVLASAAGESRHPVVMLDISRVGVCFASPALLDSGSRHILDFQLPGMPQTHETVIQVVHTSESGVPAGYRVGARFVHMEAETSESIAHFVSNTAPA
ncbi:MAG: PilZ domain-containing protein [Pseudomonadota bacterium]